VPMKPDECYIIAEAGSNHMGSQENAVHLIANGAACGADAIKFQLFKLEDILVDLSKGDSRTELPVEWLPELAGLCKEYRVDFLCTPFAPWAVEALFPHVDMWKVGRFEHGHTDLLNEIIKTGKETIASTGRGKVTPPIAGLVHDLYCVSKYPTQPSDIYLPDFQNYESVDGFSDHTTSTVIPAFAVARGARIIEKHFRLDNTPEDSPDYDHSLPPSLFAEMAHNIRLAELTCWRQPPTSPKLECYPNRREHGTGKRDMGRTKDSNSS
jgi:N,N'-diacetyllegionaminate synthase